MTVLMILIALGATAGVFLLTRAMHKLPLRAQFGVLLGLGVSIGFIFLMMVQMASFPMWLGISLVTVVFVASLFGSRIFLRSLAQEERERKTESAAKLRIIHLMADIRIWIQLSGAATRDEPHSHPC